jgi:hypothetical protein
MRTPQGITPPAPGLEREEPELRREEDIPREEGGASGRSEHGGARDERTPRSPERE